MKLTTTQKALAVVFSLAVLAGCSSQQTKDDTDASATAGGAAEDQQTGVEVGSGGEGADLTAEQMAEQKAQEEAASMAQEEAALREVRTFYFDFDTSSIMKEARMPLLAHAKFLSASPNLKVVLNGYADERGTKEYNLALGERRAKAVERFLVVNGVARDQIETVSYGEEFPADPGHDENAWAKNRRVVLEYK